MCVWLGGGWSKSYMPAHRSLLGPARAIHRHPTLHLPRASRAPRKNSHGERHKATGERHSQTVTHTCTCKKPEPRDCVPTGVSLTRMCTHIDTQPHKHMCKPCYRHTCKQTLTLNHTNTCQTMTHSLFILGLLRRTPTPSVDGVRPRSVTAPAPEPLRSSRAGGGERGGTSSPHLTFGLVWAHRKSPHLTLGLVWARRKSPHLTLGLVCAPGRRPPSCHTIRVRDLSAPLKPMGPARQAPPESSCVSLSAALWAPAWTTSRR